MEIEYIYLTALSVYIPIYLFIYLKSSLRLRREMLFMSIINAIVSPLSSYLWWNKDWWLPPSVFGGQSYVFAPEDVLLGFIFGGLVSIIYEFSFGKHLLNTEHPHKKSFNLLVLFSLIICATSFSVLNLNSFYSIVVAMLFVTFSIWFVRKDLIKSSIYTGILSLILCLPFYVTVHLLSDAWAIITYHYDFLFGINIYNFPIEEFLFWFFYGMAIGPLYEYAKGWRIK